MTAPQVPSFGMDEDLKRKLGFTILALVIYRVGAHIATPGVNVQALSDFINNSAAKGFFGLYDTLGGGLSRATVFALGIMPYISASIVLQLAGGMVPTVAKMQQDQEGQKKITQWTRYITVMISLAQAYTFGLFVEQQIPGAVAHPGFGFLATTVLVLTTGSIFVMWLGEQITERGIGNGMSLLITFAILERLWPGIINLMNYLRGGVVSFPAVVAWIVGLVVAVAATTAMTIAARRIPINVPRKVMGRGRIQEGKKSFIPVMLLTASVMPIIFAQTIIIVPGTLATFTRAPWLQDLASLFTPGDWPYTVLFAGMTLLFAYFYTSIVFPTVDIAENLKKQGAFVPGVKPGASTADYIDTILARVTLWGGVFLAIAGLLPYYLSSKLGIQAEFGGTSVLIVVGTLLDTVRQIEQHRQLRKYDSLMMKGRVRFRGRQQRFM